MKRHLSENEYAAYSGYQFTGKDPWEGKLPVTIRDITDGKMEWTFTDSFDDHTLYLVQKETVLQNGQAGRLSVFRMRLTNAGKCSTIISSSGRGVIPHRRSESASGKLNR